MRMTALSEWQLRDMREGRLVGQREGRRAGEQAVLASQRERLCEMAGRKFDAATAEELARRLDSVTDAARLLDASGAIGESSTVAELLDHVG